MWISAYIYHNDPLENVIVDAIAPFIADLLKKDLISKYFFIRYWTKGKHIRLRLEVDKNNHKLIKTMLIDHFTSYFVNHNLQHSKQGSGEYESGTIRFVSYKPETERYGGSEGVLLAEKQFMLSTKAVFTILASQKLQTGEVPNDGLFSYALQMAFLLFYVSVNTKTLKNIFNDSQNWGTENTQTFEKVFEEQQVALLKYFSNLKYESVYNVQAPDWMKDWKLGTKEVSVVLQNLVHQNSINSEKYIQILFSYMHMTNNRFGLSRYDELYLNFLLNKLFTDTE